LYDYPLIQVKLKDDEWQSRDGRPAATWKLKPNQWIWHSVFNDGVLTYLGAKDESGMRFSWGTL